MPSRRLAPAELLLRGVLGIALALALFGAQVLWAWGVALAADLGLAYWILLAGALAAAIAAAAALVGRGGAEPAPLLRVAFTLAIGVEATLVCLSPRQREPWAAAGVALAAGVYALLVLGARRAAPARPPLLRPLERATFGLALALCAAELLLHLLAAVARPALLADASDTLSFIDSQRLRPGSVRFGFPVNSRGFYDVEPSGTHAAPWIGVIGDSFGVGTVAHALLYTSIAEAELPGWELYDAAVAGADPRHYLALLEREVLPYRPDAVVIALFIGNDLEFELPEAEPGAHRLSWVGERRDLLLARLIQRLGALRSEQAQRADAQAPAGAVQGEQRSDLIPPERLTAEFPWFADPALETATFSEAGFLKIERERVLATTRPCEEYACFPWLAALRERAGAIPILVLLIPDEFQVEEDVWAEATAGTAEGLLRDQPQALVTRFCAQRNIATLDLLPALRAVPPLADGRRHLYALRDTHWNARGNAVAGHELARALRTLLGR